MTKPTVFLQELPYHPDSSLLFQRIRHLPGALIFDSCFPYSQAGRFDILTADPTEIIDFTCEKTDSYESYVDFFEKARHLHKRLFSDISSPGEEIPFCGGLAGCLDYAIGKPLQYLESDPSSLGEINVYAWAVVQDHLLQRCTFAAQPFLDKGRRADLLDLLRAPASSETTNFSLAGSFASNFTSTEYEAAFRKIQRYILDGDCYQVNLAQRFTAHYEGDPWAAYLQLRPEAGAPYSGFMERADGSQLLCLSPERFLSVHGRYVETRPIKGTRPRHRDPQTDQMLASELKMSPKDRAENLMIVDLLRNDIGKNCVPGSIHVDRLFELEAFPSVYHLVSTISGELRQNQGSFQLLRDCFPGGSITGAPKRRAMEVIDELEPNSREAYCGSLFYVAPDGRMDSNIAIRSMVCRNGSIHCWGGGGIVADSSWEREYQETYDKVGRYLAVLENTSN